jgi:hypothetical protein
MVDFTISAYKQLLETLLQHGFRLIPFADYFDRPAGKFVILRYDVDARKENALKLAVIQNELGVRGSFYFRTVPQSFDKKIILQIAELGHEIGYHYETLSTCNGNIDEAYKEFCNNLDRFRELYPVKTICMHGSPRSQFDSRELWKKYNYKDLGIIGEPYMDVDFSKVFYLTDTGRRWDGYKVSIRDKIPVYHDEWKMRGLAFRSTMEVLQAAKNNRLPDQVMITMHPQRWHSHAAPWCQEFILQYLKNIIKWYIIRVNNI